MELLTPTPRAQGKVLYDSGRRHEAIIATKFGVHSALWETDSPTGAQRVYSGDMIREAIETSLQVSLFTQYA